MPLTCVTVSTSSDIDDDSRLTHPNDVDVYFFGASGLWPSMIASDSANLKTPMSDASAFVCGSQTFPPMPLTDEDFKEPRFFCGKIVIPPSFHFG